MPQWLVELTQQAEQWDRVIRPAVRLVRDAEPWVQQALDAQLAAAPPVEAAAVIAPVIGQFRRVLHDCLLVPAVNERQYLGAAQQVLAGTDPAEVSVLAGQLLADPEQAAAVEEASRALRKTTIAGLPPADVLAIVLAWVLAAAFTAVSATVAEAGQQPVLPAVIADAPAYAALALAIMWRIRDRRR